MAETELHVVCDRNALGPSERDRQSRLLEGLRGRILETREIEGGYAFRLPADALTDAAELMSLERRCCSFLKLRLEAVASEPDVWLSLTGPSGTKAFLRQELALG